MKKLKIILIILFFSCRVFGQDTASIKKPDTLLVTKTNHLTDKSLYRTIVDKGIKYPEIAFSQALFESAHFKSNLAKINKNLFGMTVTQKRIAVGKRHGYLVYNGWTDSVEDYKIWQESLPDNALKTRTAFYNYLQKKYSVNNTYAKKIKGIVKYYKNVFSD